MIVISDSTPLNILVRIELIDVLPTLYTRVVIPTAVHSELTHANTPAEVRLWAATPPAWLEVRRPSHVEPFGRKGRGEREAISLARELNADLLLVDDRDAARTAKGLGLVTVGTLGILELASARGLCPLAESTARLSKTDFFIDDQLIKLALERDHERGRER
ncbi:MAG: DUF3368 domain-containing protein [Phycisphaerales bacterium]